MKTRKEREKKKNRKKKIEKKKITLKKEVEKISFFDNIIDKYFSEDDKDNLIGTHNNVENFYKDLKSVFRMKNN